MRSSILLISLCLLLASFTEKVNAQVAPFLTTTWNQTCYYNDSCPLTGSGGACGRTYTGCNATAMAMICKYYAYPTSGLSSHCNSNLPTQCVNFAAQTYNYSAMPNNVTSANVEVAKLMYHLGAAADMQYSGTSSNSFFDGNILKRYFAYSPRMYATATFVFSTTQYLIDALKLELDAGRPVFCKGGNHFYLIDGYDASDNFHMNFGWSGTYNNYYPINSVVNPAGTFTPVNFLFMIRPLAGDLETAVDTVVIPASGGSSNGFDFTSLLPFTISSPTSWITPNLTSGSAGFYTWSDGATFASAVNNGGIRYGQLLIQNANDIDTIVVQQDGSPLLASTDTIHFPESGGGSAVIIWYYSWSTWNTSTTSTWTSSSPVSGAGNTNTVVNCTVNLSPSPRIDYIVVAAGVFNDTIWVIQDGSTLGISFADTPEINVYPNPANDHLFLNGISANEPCEVVLFNLTGETVIDKWLQPGERSIDIASLAEGVYVVTSTSENFSSQARIVIARNRR